MRLPRSTAVSRRRTARGFPLMSLLFLRLNSCGGQTNQRVSVSALRVSVHDCLSIAWPHSAVGWQSAVRFSGCNTKTAFCNTEEVGHIFQHSLMVH